MNWLNEMRSAEQWNCSWTCKQRLNEHFLFSISASLCSLNQVIKEKFSSTIDENFSILFNESNQATDFHFHHVLSKSNNEPSKVELYLKRSQFDEENCRERFIEVIFSFDNSAHSNICSQMRNSQWLHLSTFDWQKVFVCSRHLKRPIDVFSLPIRIKDKNLMLNGNSHCDNFTRKNSSCKTQIVRGIAFQRQSLGEKSIEKRKTFLGQSKDVFFFFRTFLSERSFHFNSTKRDHSIVEIHCSNKSKTKLQQKTLRKQNFTILKEKIHRISKWNQKKKCTIQRSNSIQRFKSNKRHLQEKIDKISRILTRKFSQFDSKTTGENAEFRCNLIENLNRSENGEKQRSLKRRISKIW